MTLQINCWSTASTCANNLFSLFIIILITYASYSIHKIWIFRLATSTVTFVQARHSFTHCWNLTVIKSKIIFKTDEKVSSHLKITSIPIHFSIIWVSTTFIIMFHIEVHYLQVWESSAEILLPKNV